MKILLVNVTKDKGSTGRIVSSLFNELKKQGHDVKLIYGRGPKTKHSDFFIKKTCELESKFCHLLSLFTGDLYGLMLISTHRIKKAIKKINPDVINLHCINGYFVNIYRLLKWLAKKNYKTILTMHAEFMMTGGCGYTIECNHHINCECKNCKFIKEINGKYSLNRTHHFYKKMEKSILCFSKDKLKISCVSPWLTKRFKESPIYKNYEIKTIINPVDEIFFTNSDISPYSTKNNILYVTPDISDYVKTGWLIRDIARRRPDLNFTIVCGKQIDFEFDEKNIKYISGGLGKEKLRDYYHFADGTILLSKRETFSMVVCESLAAGTPIYGFKSGGPETICIDEFSSFCDYGNIELLSSNLLSMKCNKEVVSNKAFEKYNIKTICAEYFSIYKI